MAAPSVATSERIRREARLSGLREFRTPSLESVERRRIELWTSVLVISIAIAGGMVLVSTVPLGSTSRWLSPSILRVALLLVSFAFGTYAVEKELHLRRLSRLLIDERVLTAALSNRLKELSALMTAGKAMNSVLELPDVLDIILSSALELLDGSNGSIMLLEASDELRAVCVRGESMARDARVRVGEGIAGHVAETREALLISGEVDRDRFANLAPREYPVESAICVPLMNREELLGVLNINAAANRRFNEYELRALTLFAEHAAVSIANARLYEQERARVSELLEVDQLKTEFVATVSHELRTPLTSILGSVVTLRRLDVAAEHRDGLLDVIERQGNRLLRLIEQLLTAARLEHEDDLSFAEPVDVPRVVRMVARDFDATDRPVEISGPDHLLALANADALQQILVNLLDNAHKYGARPVRVMVERTGSRVAVTVIDGGPGIPRADRERIFDGFTRLDGNGSNPGIGLGLSIVRRLVAACNGTVRLDDAPGGGAAFRVSLAAAREEAER